MVPSGVAVVDVWVAPLVGEKIETDDVVVLGLSRPSTIRVELVINNEDGVAATTLWVGLVADYGFVEFPLTGLDVVGVHIIEGLARVEETTVSTIDVDFAFVVAGGSVSSWGWCINGGLLVLTDGLIALGTGPSAVGVLQPPTVIESDLR